MTDKATISLNIDGPEVPAGKFLNAVKNFYTLLRSVSEEYAGDPKALDWSVTVERGSNIVHFHPIGQEYEVVKGVVDAAYDGFAKLEQENISQPPYFNTRALEAARYLASLPTPNNGVRTVEISRNGSKIDLSGHLVATADDVLKAKYEDYGSIDGRLEVISNRRGAKIIVYDDYNDRPVRCYFDLEVWEEVRQQAADAFTERVSVYGLIEYRQNGEPLSIRVESFRVLSVPALTFDVGSIIGIMR